MQMTRHVHILKHYVFSYPPMKTIPLPRGENRRNPLSASTHELVRQANDIVVFQL